MPSLNAIAADRYNEKSARLQIATGVDPELCLKVEIVPGHERTKLPMFFAYLQRARWATPETPSELPSNVIDWTKHDANFHWPGVRDLHPNFVPVVMFAARIGAAHLGQGEITAAERLAVDLDYFVDRGVTANHYNDLMNACGVVVMHEALDFSVLAAHRDDIRSLAISTA